MARCREGRRHHAAISHPIKGEKQEEKEEKKKDYYLHERHIGSFERHFELPEGVDTDKIEASFKNGVLTVRLPKKFSVGSAYKLRLLNKILFRLQTFKTAGG